MSNTVDCMQHIAYAIQQSELLVKYNINYKLHTEHSSLSAYEDNTGIDKNFTFRSHISAICSSCFYHMQDLRRICRHLDLDSAKLLATALMFSRLNYCNSLLYGIADIDLTRLQRVQNQLACLVTKSPPFTHSLSLLCSLRWLPVKFRILFKINLLTYKPCLKNSLFIFTPCLPHRFLPVHWDQTLIIVC